MYYAIRLTKSSERFSVEKVMLCSIDPDTSVFELVGNDVIAAIGGVKTIDEIRDCIIGVTADELGVRIQSDDYDAECIISLEEFESGGNSDGFNISQINALSDLTYVTAFAAILDNDFPPVGYWAVVSES